MDETKVISIPGGGDSSVPAWLPFMANGGGFGGMNNPLWMMFMYPFILPFLSMYGNGFGGFGGFGGGAGNVLGTGFLSNQLNNSSDKETILNALQYNREAISQLANQFGTSISDVQNNIAIANSKLADIGAQLGMTGMQVINAVQSGDAALGRQLCECCCYMRYDLAQQTNALQAQAAQNASAAQLQLAGHDSNVRLQLAQNEAADQLAVCQQTNAISTQADRNTNNILGAIAAQNTLITKEFCDLKERELQNKINTQSDVITQLRGQISNDKQTEAFNVAFNSLNDKINTIAARQPNTVPVVWPNLTAVNNTPYAGGYPYYGNGFGGGIVF
jgi:hypothetical protein